MALKRIPRFKLSLSLTQVMSGIRLLLRSFLFSKNETIKNYRDKFEKAFANYIGVKTAIATSSARVGLYLILKNLGLNKGSHVILPCFTYPAVPAVIKAAGFKPIFVDIVSETYQFNFTQLKRCINSKTKVIIPTHLYGFPCQLDQINQLCQQYGLIMIEDCAQSCGAFFKSNKVGSLGKASYFSFSLTKNITTLGGGMITTDDMDLADKIRKDIKTNLSFPSDLEIIKEFSKVFFMNIATLPFIFTFFVFSLIYFFHFIDIDIIDFIAGEKVDKMKKFNKNKIKTTLNQIQAYLGINQLRNLDFQNSKRIKNGKFLNEKLQGLKDVLALPKPLSFTEPIYLSFPLQLKNRDEFARILMKKGIDTSLGYIKDCSRLYNGSSYQASSSNVAYDVEQSIVHIPVYPQLKTSDLIYIAKTIKQAAKRVIHR